MGWLCNQRGYEEIEESDEEQAAHLAFARKHLKWRMNTCTPFVCTLEEVSIADGGK